MVQPDCSNWCSIMHSSLQELERGMENLLIPTPNAINKCGYNTDRFVINPDVSVIKNHKSLMFLGVLLGVALRTRKPLDLHLARPVWKLLVGLSLKSEDLEEVQYLNMCQIIINIIL